MENIEFGEIYTAIVKHRHAPVMALYDADDGALVVRTLDTGRAVKIRDRSRIVGTPEPDPADDPETVDRWRAEAAAKRKELFGQPSPASRERLRALRAAGLKAQPLSESADFSPDTLPPARR